MCGKFPHFFFEGFPKSDKTTESHLKSYLKSHVESVHENRKPHKCTVCNYSCSQKSTLKMHVVSVHENEKPYKCPG